MRCDILTFQVVVTNDEEACQINLSKNFKIFILINNSSFPEKNINSRLTS